MGFLVLLNGPPRCGKDSLADALVADRKFLKMKMAQPLKDAIAAFFGLDEAQIDDIVENHKGTPHELLMGAEIRDLMIDLSERWAKPRCGQDVFGKLMARRFEGRFIGIGPNAKVVISDSGFPFEVPPFLEAVRDFHKLIVHISRDGCEWDSRHPFPTTMKTSDSDVNPLAWGWVDEFDHIHIDNSELTLKQHIESGVNMVEAWMNGKA